LCDALNAEIEVDLYLPYAAAAELEPIAVGYVPLSVNTESQPNIVQGIGHISYDQMNTWIFEGGHETAEVFLELDLIVSGKCIGNASDGGLILTLNAIHLEDYGTTQCGYPSGTCSHSPVLGPIKQSFELEFPLVDGTKVQREDWTSWTFVLHLSDQ